MGLKVLFDDITKLMVDAVVNSTNPNLIGYSGVDRIIHELGGEELEEACAKLSGKLVLGEAVSTKAYNIIEQSRSCTNNCSQRSVVSF